MERIITFFLLLTFISCNESSHDHTTITVYGRNKDDQNFERLPIYEIDLPSGWEVIQHPENSSIIDTKKSLCDLVFTVESEKIVVTIHNFPSLNLKQRIPPRAQVERWKNQIEDSQELKQYESSISFGGFCGIKFQGVGVIQKKLGKMIAWAMQLPEEHYYNLNYPNEDLLPDEQLQMRADYTIKVVGPENLIDAQQESIEKIAKSFRLIKKIPCFN